MAEWDPDRERYEPERDMRRDYQQAGRGIGERGQPRGVWSTGGNPRRPGDYGDWEHAGRGGGYGEHNWDGMGGDSNQARGPHVGKGPKGYQRSDERIREDVCDQLERDPDIDASDMEVTVRNREVTLTGVVQDRWMKRRSEDLVASCPGVVDVQNRLQIRREDQAPAGGDEESSRGSSPRRR